MLFLNQIGYKDQMEQEKKIPESKSKQKEENWSTRFALEEQIKGKCR